MSGTVQCVPSAGLYKLGTEIRPRYIIVLRQNQTDTYGVASRPATTSELKSLCWSCLCVKKSMCPSQWRWSAGNKALKTTAACSDLRWQCI